MNRLIFTYITAFLIFFGVFKFSGPKYIKKPEYLTLKLTLTQSISDEKLADFYYGLLTGDLSLKNTEKAEIKKLKLSHLFTPSGLHLGIILIAFLPLLRKRKKLKRLLLLLAIFLPLPWPSFKRVALFTFLKTYSDRKYFLYLLTFIIDLFLNFEQSPMSYAFSYLFLGVIHSRNKFNEESLLYCFFAAHLLIGVFTGEDLFFIHFFWGVLITALFTIFFPLVILDLIPIFIFKQSIFEKIISIYFDLIFFLKDIPLSSLKTSASIFLFIASLYLIARIKRKFIIATLLLFHQTPIFSGSNVRENKSHTLIEPEGLVSVQKTKNGIKTSHKNGEVCYHKIIGDLWNTNCSIRK